MTDKFAAAPKVVKPKKKYKERQTQEAEQEEIKLIYNNLMWDKRIVRGNTYSAIVTSKNVEAPQGGLIRRPQMTLKPQGDQNADIGNRRANIQIFTDQYVQSLTDKPPRYQYGSQTDFISQKLIVRHKMDEKIGQDIQTQIWDNQLFDFDYEVEPLLHVLCGRTLQVSRMQVLQEQQLRIMRDKQNQLKILEDLQRKKIEEMYALQQKLQIENAKRIEGYKKDKQKKKKTHKRLFSRVLAKQYFSHIKDDTLQIVQNLGFFRNPIQLDLTAKILPQCYSESQKYITKQQNMTRQAYNILEQVRKTLIKQHAWHKEVEKTRRNSIIENRKRQARQKLQRKLMLAQEKYMKNFLQEEKIQKEKQEAARKAAQQLEEGGQNQQQS